MHKTVELSLTIELKYIFATKASCEYKLQEISLVTRLRYLRIYRYIYISWFLLKTYVYHFYFIHFMYFDINETNDV